MGIPKNILNETPGLSTWCILLMYRGSIAHGMYVPNSDPNSIDDKDVMAVCVPALDHYFGLKQFGARGTQEIKRDEWDIVIYEAKKFISLLLKGNPNVLSALWLEEKHYLHKTKAGQLLIDNRQLFVGKHVYRSFTGYAYSQLHRMTKFVFNGYMGEKRKQLVEKFGFDTKNAAHLIRLLRMGIEFLIDGVLYVERHDAQQLLQIKRGEWTLEQVKAEADRLFASAEQAYMNSKLPKNLDGQKINELCMAIIEETLLERHELGYNNGVQLTGKGGAKFPIDCQVRLPAFSGN
jgi:predicted nucleotidyltransferase